MESPARFQLSEGRPRARSCHQDGWKNSRQVGPKSDKNRLLVGSFDPLSEVYFADILARYFYH